MYRFPAKVRSDDYAKTQHCGRRNPYFGVEMTTDGINRSLSALD